MMTWSNYVTSPSYRSLEQMSSTYAIADNSSPFRLLSTVGASSTAPNFGHLTLLVFEAILEVVCVSLPGYIVAKQGFFDPRAQKFIGSFNVMLFTPCMVFTKLSSQLTPTKLKPLAIIPLIFVIQTLVSFSGAWLISTILRLKKRQKNFVIAMGIFGNSNSLPISLVMSLSKTLSGLHWDRIPGDNDNEVAARGILYLVIFQQLGQLLRWTWGYNVLLAPADRFTEAEGGTAKASNLERGRSVYRDDSPLSSDRCLLNSHGLDNDADGDSDFDDQSTRVANSPVATSRARSPKQFPSSDDSLVNSELVPYHLDLAKAFHNKKFDEDVGGVTGFINKVQNRAHVCSINLSEMFNKVFNSIPSFIRKPIKATFKFIRHVFAGVWAFMNPPLWAMVVAVVVVFIPQLQNLFYNNGGFVRNSVTVALEQNAAVAIPLLLVVLGGNLASRTDSDAGLGDLVGSEEEHKLLIAALCSRMVFPVVVMGPILACIARFISVSVLEDKIFIIVCFLLAGAPSALQLAQICQVNNVYTGVVSKLFFQAYVIWILPSTLILVVCALSTVKWAQVAQ